MKEYLDNSRKNIVKGKWVIRAGVIGVWILIFQLFFMRNTAVTEAKENRAVTSDKEIVALKKLESKEQQLAEALNEIRTLKIEIGNLNKKSGVKRELEIQLNDSEEEVKALQYALGKMKITIKSLAEDLKNAGGIANKNAVYDISRVDESPQIQNCNYSTKLSQFHCFKTKVILHVLNTFKYPELSRKFGVEGKVYINLVIEKNGSLGIINIAKSSGSIHLDNEAIRVIQSLPKIIPAKLNGEPDRMSYTVPINCTLSAVTVDED